MLLTIFKIICDILYGAISRVTGFNLDYWLDESTSRYITNNYQNVILKPDGSWELQHPSASTQTPTIPITHQVSQISHNIVTKDDDGTILKKLKEAPSTVPNFNELNEQLEACVNSGLVSIVKHELSFNGSYFYILKFQ